MLFAAEWGDLSQLLTISLVAGTTSRVDVFLGAWAALLTVSGLAVLAGRVLLRYLSSRCCTTSAPASAWCSRCITLVRDPSRLVT